MCGPVVENSERIGWAGYIMTIRAALRVEPYGPYTGTTLSKLLHCRLPGIFPPPLASPGRMAVQVSARHYNGTVSGCLAQLGRYIPMDIEAPRSLSHEPIAAGVRTRIAGVYIPLDWATLAVSPDCADWCRRSCAGLTQVGTG